MSTTSLCDCPPSYEDVLISDYEQPPSYAEACFYNQQHSRLSYIQQQSRRSSIQQHSRVNYIQQQSRRNSFQQQSRRSSIQQQSAISNNQRQPTFDNHQQQPITDNNQHQPTLDNNQPQPIISSNQQQPIISNNPQQPIIGNNQQAPISPTSAPLEEFQDLQTAAPVINDAICTTNNIPSSDTRRQSRVAPTVIGEDIRRGRKVFFSSVYGIISVQLLVDAAFMLIFFLPPVQTLALGSILVFIIFACRSCFPKDKRSLFEAMFGLTLQTMPETILCIIVSKFANTASILVATSITGVVCFLMTCFSVNVGTGGGLVLYVVIIVASFVILMFSLGNVFSVFYLVSTFVGVVIFLTFLAYDAHLMATGQHKQSEQIIRQGYLDAVQTFYLDILLLWCCCFPARREDCWEG